MEWKIRPKYQEKRRGENTDNPSIRIFVDKIEHRILFKLKQHII